MPDEKQEITNDDTGIKRSNPQVFNGISVTWTPSMNKCYTRFSGEACSGLESCNPAGG